MIDPTASVKNENHAKLLGRIYDDSGLMSPVILKPFLDGKCYRASVVAIVWLGVVIKPRDALSHTRARYI